MSEQGPWAKLIEERFSDPDLQAEVDAFLRENIQPYVTKKEEDAALAEGAKALYDDFQSDPGQAWVNVTAEIFGEDRANEVLAYLKSQGLEAEGDGPTDPTPSSSLPPEQQQVLDWANEQRNRSLYEENLNALAAAHPEFDDKARKLIAPFITAADGDMEVAFAGYTAWLAEAVGVPAAPEEPTTAEPPPVIGSGDGAPPAPPTVKRGQSLDAALDDFFNEQKSSAPPTVGSI